MIVIHGEMKFFRNRDREGNVVLVPAISLSLPTLIARSKCNGIAWPSDVHTKSICYEDIANSNICDLRAITPAPISTYPARLDSTERFLHCKLISHVDLLSNNDKIVFGGCYLCRDRTSGSMSFISCSDESSDVTGRKKITTE